MAQAAEAVQLSKDTLLAFAEYIGRAEAGMEQSLHGGLFLWCEARTERTQPLLQGQILAEC